MEFVKPKCLLSLLRSGMLDWGPWADAAIPTHRLGAQYRSISSHPAILTLDDL